MSRSSVVKGPRPRLGKRTMDYVYVVTECIDYEGSQVIAVTKTLNSAKVRGEKYTKKKYPGYTACWEKPLEPHCYTSSITPNIEIVVTRWEVIP